LIVSVSELAVIEPRATSKALNVTVDVLAMPFTVSVPPLAVIDPRSAVVTNSAGAVITAALAMPLVVNVPALAVIIPAPTTNQAPHITALGAGAGCSWGGGSRGGA